jgi:hypothetical protein
MRILRAFSDGRISQEQVIRRLRLRDYAALLVKMGGQDLPAAGTMSAEDIGLLLDIVGSTDGKL